MVDWKEHGLGADIVTPEAWLFHFQLQGARDLVTRLLTPLLTDKNGGSKIYFKILLQGCGEVTEGTYTQN